MEVFPSPSAQAKPPPERAVHTYPEKVFQNYRDHSNVTERGLTLLLPNEDSKRKVVLDQSFPVRLHYFLGRVDNDGLSDIVSWRVHGRCFLVHDQDRFVKEILPLWFRQSTYASFQRQLNLYGFRRLTRGCDKGAYFHEKFLRSKRFLAARIERKKVKGTGSRKPSSPETEPDFYMFSFLPQEKLKEETSHVVHAGVAPAAPIPTVYPSGPPKASTEPSIQTLLLSSSLSELPLQLVHPSTYFWSTSSPHMLAPSTGSALLLEAQRAQVASSLLLAQLHEQQQRQEIEARYRLARLMEARVDAAWLPVPSHLNPLGQLPGQQQEEAKSLNCFARRLMESGGMVASSVPSYVPDARGQF